jgi:hypothetical protein
MHAGTAELFRLAPAGAGMKLHQIQHDPVIILQESGFDWGLVSFGLKDEYYIFADQSLTACSKLCQRLFSKIKLSSDPRQSIRSGSAVLAGKPTNITHFSKPKTRDFGGKR